MSMTNITCHMAQILLIYDGRNSSKLSQGVKALFLDKGGSEVSIMAFRMIMDLGAK